MRNKNKFNDTQRRQIRHWKKKIGKVSLLRKIQVLDYAAKGYTNAQISDLTDYTIRRISSLITEYLTNGIGYFLEERKIGGNRRIVSIEQETSILEMFEERAKKGKVVSLRDVKKEYDKVRGKEVANSTFYDFLNRREWRKVMPRGAHPKKASEAEIEASKKLTLR